MRCGRYVERERHRGHRAGANGRHPVPSIGAKFHEDFFERRLRDGEVFHHVSTDRGCSTASAPPRQAETVRRTGALEDGTARTRSAATAPARGPPSPQRTPWT